MSSSKVTLDWNDSSKSFTGVESLTELHEVPEVLTLANSFLQDLMASSGLRPQKVWIKTVISLSVILSSFAAGFLLLGMKKVEILGMLLICLTPFSVFLYIMLSCKAQSRSQKVNGWLKHKLRVYSNRFKTLGYSLNCVFQQGKQFD
jgi:hypothetical protein